MEHVVLTGNDVFHQAVSCFIDIDVFLRNTGKSKATNRKRDRCRLGRKEEKEGLIDECKHFYGRNKTTRKTESR